MHQKKSNFPPELHHALTTMNSESQENRLYCLHVMRHTNMTDKRIYIFWGCICEEPKIYEVVLQKSGGWLCHIKSPHKKCIS